MRILHMNFVLGVANSCLSKVEIQLLYRSILRIKENEGKVVSSCNHC